MLFRSFSIGLLLGVLLAAGLTSDATGWLLASHPSYVFGSVTDGIGDQLLRQPLVVDYVRVGIGTFLVSLGTVIGLGVWPWFERVCVAFGDRITYAMNLDGPAVGHKG